MDDNTQPEPKRKLNLRSIAAPPGPKPKTHLANLAAAMKCFKPHLVNESDKKPDVEYKESTPGSGQFWDGTFIASDDSPNPHQLVNLVFAAMTQITEFTQLHERLKGQLAVTQRAFQEIEEIVLPKDRNKETLNPAETIATITRIHARHAQMCDVIEKAASSSPEQALKTCQAWQIPNGINLKVFQTPGSQPSN